MKAILIILILTGKVCSAQVCDTLTAQVIDKVTGDTTRISKANIVLTDNAGKTRIVITCLKYEGNVILSFKVVGAGSCVSEADKINFVLADSSRLEIKNDHKFNCQGAMKLYFGGPFGKVDQLDKLLSGNVVTIRAWIADKYMQQNLTNQQAKQLRETLVCLKGSK
jgi:hypothetical protein